MTFCHVNGVNIHYREFGDGPPVVLAHGVGGNVVGWWQQIRPLSEKFRVITFDARSFGLSEGDGADAGMFVADLEGLLDALGLESVALLGQSMGGFTCSGFASQHPDRVGALILSGSPAGLAPPRTEEEIEKRFAPGMTWPEFLHQSVGHGAFPQRHPDLFVLYDFIADLNQGASFDVLRTLGRTSHDISPIVEHGIPVMLISGEDDIQIGQVMDGIASKIPGSERVVIPDAGHLAYGEQADVFNGHVLRFLQEKLAT